MEALRPALPSAGSHNRSQACSTSVSPVDAILGKRHPCKGACPLLGICLAALLLCAFFWHKGRKTGDVEGMAPDKWKRRAWSCLAMAAITLGAFAVHMLDCRVQYMVGISQGWPAPFWVYALPLAVGYGAGALALLALGFAFRRQARREADLPNKIDG